jgi:TonB family protein
MKAGEAVSEIAIDEPLVPDRPADGFRRYVIRGLVGEGSMARVYRAADPLTGRDVAIKVLKRETRVLYAATARTRFIREAEAAGRLAHPHIVTIYDVSADYIVMELLEGTSLEERLRAPVVLTLEQVMAIVHPLADALDYAHRRGIVHRDVKPGNIVVSATGRPTLTDFGVAHLDSPTITAAGEFLGSPCYMAPEQMEGGAITPRSDVFSLAAVVYEMVTGTKAFAGTSVPQAVHSVLFTTPEPPSRLRPHLPPVFDAVLARGLAKNPRERFASAGELAAALDPAGFERTLAQIGRAEAWMPVEGAAIVPGRPRDPRIETAKASTSFSRVETRDLGLMVRPWLAAPSVMPRPRGLRHWLAVVLAGTAIAIVSNATARRGVQGQPMAAAVPPTIDIDTAPAGAAVWLDDRPLGHTPLRALAFPAGDHSITIDEPRFARAHVQMTSAGSPGAVQTRFTLRPRAAEHIPGAGTTIGIARAQGQIETQVGGRRDSAWQPPRRLAGEPTRYPPEALALRLQGTVIVEMTIDEGGNVHDVQVVESAGDVLDNAVLGSVYTWHFAPASLAGVVQSVRWQVRERFTLAP